MDLQTRKLAFIQEFLKVQSEELISRLENILKSNNEDFSLFTSEELNSRINAAMEDSKKDQVTESTELIAEIKQWQ
ncbi:MAG: hypothetical protein ITF99_01580 [Chryseobacterium sp.]|nr:hypothetical protein [Chryseobacterium sp.]